VCFGGTLVNVTDSDEVVVFDIHVKRWEWVVPRDGGAAMPAARRLCACFYDGLRGTLTISHGWSGAELVGFKDMWDFDVAGRTWSVVDETRQGMVSEAVDSALWTAMPSRVAYLFGGWGESTTLNVLWSHNMDTRRNTLVVAEQPKPQARNLHCVTNIGTTMYVLLGINAGGRVLDDVWMYDTTRDVWSQVIPSGTVIPARYGASCVSQGSLMYIFGGRKSQTAFLNQFSNSLYTLDASNVTTQVQPRTSRPDARYQHAATMYRDNLYVYGGKGGGSFPFGDMWVFVTAISDWRLVQRDTTTSGGSSGMPALPGLRYRCVLGVVGTDSLLLAEGDDGTTNWGDRWVTSPTVVDASDNYFANFTQLSSTNTEPLVLADVVRTGPQMVVGYNGTRVVFLGGSMDGDSEVERSTIHVFDVVSGTNTLVGAMPVPVTEQGAVFIGRSIYVFGGRRMGQGVILDATSTLQKYTSATSHCAAGATTPAGVRRARAVSLGLGARPAP
jgi:hypothetical protein